MSNKRSNKPQWNNNNSKGNKNKGTKKFCVLIGNYPPTFSAEGIIRAIANQVRRITNNELNYNHELIYPDTLEFAISFPNKQQMDAVLELNGTFICNNPIWIIKYPDEYSNLALDLSEIFSTSTCNGQIDLSNLKYKFDQFKKDSSYIDFNKQDFVEFLLYRLGTESRDKRFYVDTLILTNNFIEDINRWSPYLVFLPTLHTIILNQNPLKQQPNLPAYPYITVVCDVKIPKNNKNQNAWGKGQKQNSNNQSPWNSNQNQSQNQNPWNSNQNQNPWNSNQNQNGRNTNQNQNPWDTNQNQRQNAWNSNQNQNDWNKKANPWEYEEDE